MQHHIVLRFVGKLFIPLVMLFGLYVQFHGDFGPGGGFQAGVIFAAAIILHALLFSVDTTQSVVPLTLLKPLAAIGVLIYASVGVVGIFLGGNYLDYNVLGSTAIAGQHLGILLVELGVGITVASVMILLFFCFARTHEAGTVDQVDENDLQATVTPEYDPIELLKARDRAIADELEPYSTKKTPTL